MANESDTPYQQPADTIRTTAKWLVTAFAGVGGILVAGIPLSKLGDLRGWRLILGLAAIVIALAMIFYIIPLVSRVFTAKYITLADFGLSVFPTRTGESALKQVSRRIEPIEEAVESSGYELFGADAASLADLNRQITEVTEKLREESLEPGERMDALSKRERLMDAAGRVVAFANYEEVRQTFKKSYKPMAGAALIVALALMGFAYAVGSTPPPPTVPNVTSPSPVLLKLDPKGAEWAKLLGNNCDIYDVDAVAISGDFSTPLVVTIPTKECNMVRFELTPKMGIAVPRAPSPTPNNGVGRP